MYNLAKIKSAFTLVEVLVSITIFSIIMISVMMIFASVTGVSAKIDINRSMQENTKNITELIAKDVLDYGISWVSSEKGLDCTFSDNNLYDSWDKLCLWDVEYFLAIKTIDDSWNRVEFSEMEEKCSDITSECSLVKKDSDWEVWMVSNSQVYFRDLIFTISQENIKKVTINFTMQPSAKKWVKPDLIKNSEMIFQTTLSERLIKTNSN